MMRQINLNLSTIIEKARRLQFLTYFLFLFPEMFDTLTQQTTNKIYGRYITVLCVCMLLKEKSFVFVYLVIAPSSLGNNCASLSDFPSVKKTSISRIAL